MAGNDLARVDPLIDDLLQTHDPKHTDPAAFRGAQYDRGLAWVHFPEGFGGVNLPPIVQRRPTAVASAGALGAHWIGLPPPGIRVPQATNC